MAALTAADLTPIADYVARRVRNGKADQGAPRPLAGVAYADRPDPPDAAAIAVAGVAFDVCHHHAASAPLACRIEAAIRTAGWLRDNDPAIATRDVADGTSITARAAAPGALRGSGAMALLSPYRLRRLAKVEDDD